MASHLRHPNFPDRLLYNFEVLHLYRNSSENNLLTVSTNLEGLGTHGKVYLHRSSVTSGLPGSRGDLKVSAPGASLECAFSGSMKVSAAVDCSTASMRLGDFLSLLCSPRFGCSSLAEFGCDRSVVAVNSSSAQRSLEFFH